MEALNVFATMNLIDMMSSPLAKINGATVAVDEQMKKLDKTLGGTKASMLPLAVASGVVVGALGACVKQAIAFESSMADVAKVVNFTSETELKNMEKTILDMSTRIPMAADGIAAIIASAAQSGVAKKDLTEFAEQAAKMGVAFDLTGDQAGKMMADWKAGMGLALPQVYALADAVNHLSNNMNATAPALGEVLQRAGALGMIAGGLETEVAALGAAFLSAGASPEIAATALKKFTGTLTKGIAMTDTQAEAFASLGFNAEELAKRMQVDAKGAIFDVLNALAKMPEYMHGAMLTQMFGEESIGAIAPLLKNMDTLSNAFDLVSDKSKYAGSMQAEFEARSKTVANAIQLLQNKLTKLGIIIGTYLLPVVSVLINIFGSLISGITVFMETPLGKVFTEIAAAVSFAGIAIASFMGILWVKSAIFPIIAKGLTTLKASFLALSLPIQILIVSIGLLYLAYRSNFGGIADSIDAFYTKAKIVFQAVTALFTNFKDGSASITGELAKQIQSNGLEEIVTFVFKIIRRIKAYFTGFYEAVKNVLYGVYWIFDTVFGFLFNLIGKLLDCLGLLGSGFKEIKNYIPTNHVQEFGRITGYLTGGILVLIAAKKAWIIVTTKLTGLMNLLTKAVTGFHTVLKWCWTAIKLLGSSLLWVLKIFLRYMILKPLAIAFNILTIAVKGFIVIVKALGIALKFLALNPVGLALTALITIIGLVIYNCDTLRTTIINAFNTIWNFISGFFSNIWNLIKNFALLYIEQFSFIFNSIKAIFGGIWDFIIGLFSGKSLYDSGVALINTFKDGILAAWSSLKQSFYDVLDSLRNMLPFSDAKEGPLSTLTLSGNRLISTIGEGVGQAAPAFIKDVNGVFSQINPSIPTPLNLDTKNIQSVPSLIESPSIDKTLNPYVSSAPLTDFTSSTQKKQSQTNQTNKEHGQISYTINIQNITLPNVQNAHDFMKQLENELIAYGVS